MVVATNAMRKSKLSSDMSIVIDGKEVAETASEKLLGVRMNQFEYAVHICFGPRGKVWGGIFRGEFSSVGNV